MVGEAKLPANQVPQINLDMEYGLANQLTQVQQMPTVFDEDGNLQQAVLKGENVNFTFNSRNQLLQSNNVHYQYDAENQRIAVNQTQPGRVRTVFLVRTKNETTLPPFYSTT